MGKESMKNNKKLAVVIIIIGILYAAIFAVVMFIVIFQPYTVYENPDLIAGRLDGSSSKINYRASTQDGITTINCKKMTGMDTIWKYQADKDMTLQMHYNLKVTAGKAKLVLITPDDTIVTLTEQDSSTSQEYAEQGQETTANSNTEASDTESTAELTLKKGTNRIKIVCEKGTAFSLSFHITD